MHSRLELSGLKGLQVMEQLVGRSLELGHAEWRVGGRGAPHGFRAMEQNCCHAPIISFSTLLTRVLIIRYTKSSYRKHKDITLALTLGRLDNRV